VAWAPSVVLPSCCSSLRAAAALQGLHAPPTTGAAQRRRPEAPTFTIFPIGDPFESAGPLRVTAVRQVLVAPLQSRSQHRQRPQRATACQPLCSAELRTPNAAPAARKEPGLRPDGIQPRPPLTVERPSYAVRCGWRQRNRACPPHLRDERGARIGAPDAA